MKLRGFYGAAVWVMRLPKAMMIKWWSYAWPNAWICTLLFWVYSSRERHGVRSILVGRRRGNLLFSSNRVRAWHSRQVPKRKCWKTCVRNTSKWPDWTGRFPYCLRCRSAQQNALQHLTSRTRYGRVGQPVCQRLSGLSTLRLCKVCGLCKRLYRRIWTCQFGPVPFDTFNLPPAYLTCRSLISFTHGVMAALCALHRSIFCSRASST